MTPQQKTTILIHGHGFDQRIWYPLEIAFEGHHVIYLALPGFGIEPVTSSYTITELASKYWRHLDEINVQQVNLVGHSMGGYVCMDMLAQQPSRVSSLALVHSHVYADTPEKKLARSEVLQNIKSNGREEFINKFIPSLFAERNKSPQLIKMLVTRGIAYDENAWSFGIQAIRDRKNHSETLKDAHIPVLLQTGESDPAVPAELAYKQASLAQQCSFHMYPGVGHLGMYESPRQMIVDLISFYDDLVV